MKFQKGQKPWNIGVKYSKQFVNEHKIGLNPNSIKALKESTNKRSIDSKRFVAYEKLCECGCGDKIIWKSYYDKHGPPKYISGHNGRKYPKIITEKIIKENETICSCGCENIIPFSPFHLRRKPRFIYGHNYRGHHHTIEEGKKIGDAQRGKPGKFTGHKQSEKSRKLTSEKLKLSHSNNPEKWTNSYHNGFEKSWKKKEFREKQLELLKSEEFIKKCLGRRIMSSLETKFNNIIQKHNLPYKFVGNGKFFIEKKNPDFVNVNGEKIVIEVFCRKHKCMVHDKINNKFCIGYDENKLNEWKEKRNKIFNKYGYKVIFFDETEVKEENVIEKLLGGN